MLTRYRIYALLVVVTTLASSMSIPAFAGEVTIGSGTGQSQIPLRTIYQDSRTQVIYLSSEVGASCIITALALDVSSLPGQTMNSFTIRMKSTSLSSYGVGAWESSGWTTVYQASQTISSTGWNTFAFSVPFAYNAADNLMVDFSFNNSTSSSSGTCRYSTSADDRALNYGTSSGGFGDPLTWSGTNNPPPSGVDNYFPNIRLTTEPLVQVFPPEFSPDGGVFLSPPSVTVTCGIPGATIHYTIDGQEPTEGSPTITSGSSVTVAVPTTLKAKAWKEGLSPSETKTAIFRAPAPIYIKPDGDDNDDGLSWAAAKRTVQGAVAAAYAGDEIWVSSGSYLERVTVKEGVSLYGGFAGTETTRSERDWRNHIAILDGSATPGIGVTAPSGCTSATRIDGFTIQYYSDDGINCAYSSPTIANNTIAMNSGSGIYCSNSAAVISSNYIVANQSGGIYGFTGTSVTAVNNIVEGNSGLTGDFGTGNGAIYCAGSSTVTNNTVISNQNTGIYSSGNVSNNVVAFNYEGIVGGTSTVIRNNNVYGNGTNYRNVSAGTGDISVDPLLVSVELGRIHIQPASPCRNAGWNAAPGLPSIDIDGQTRILNSTVDIGADESDGSTWPSTPAIVRVSPSGNDANDGSTWPLAKKTVQAGIVAASRIGGEVWVGAGRYTEHVRLWPFANIYGGFAGTESAKAERNWTLNRSVIDGGSGLGRVVTVYGGRTTAQIDGFTLQNGSGDAPGIRCDSSSIVVANNIIRGNVGTSYLGGGINCGPDSGVRVTVTITNNLITGNQSRYGSGIRVARAQQATVTNNTVVNNFSSSTTPGGSVYLTECLSSTFSNNIVAFNIKGIEVSSTSPTLRNNDVYSNGTNYIGVAAGTGDISADPQIVAAEYGQVHIQASSPCFNAGWSSAPGLPSTDIDGQPRIQSTAVDIGADESDGIAPSYTPGVVRVSVSGDDANDGSSWALAKRTVQDGIDTAMTVGGEVWVKAGTYNEALKLRPFVYLYGGFAGTETSRSERDWSVNKTVIDGGGANSVIYAETGMLAGSIDGFTIQNSGYGNKAGGVYCMACSPTIANNIIRRNYGAPGGGIFCLKSASKITNNYITENGPWAMYDGAGIYLDTSDCTVSGNVVIGNNGGGIWANGQSVTITGNTIVGNGCGEAGALYVPGSASTAMNNIVAFNSSGIKGGAATLRNNDVYGNTAFDYSGLSAGIGDISLDPKLVSAGYGQIHIQSDSPCRNAGNNGAPSLPLTDMDGQPRIQNGIVDIGADESNGSLWSYAPAVVRVSPYGDDSHDGSSWALAKKTIQAAIDAAEQVGGEVWAAKGTYDEQIVLWPFVYLYGGFVGNEISKSSRNWAANECELTGGGIAPIVTVKAGHLNNCIDGFIIRGGQSTENMGGGVGCRNFASTTIANNIIADNRAYNGGGVYCSRSYSIISNNTIVGNSVNYFGSGIECTDYSGCTLTNNTIAGNTCLVSMLSNSALECYWSPGTRVSNNVIAFNSHGIRAEGATPTLRNNNVFGNTAYGYSGVTAGTGDTSADPLFTSPLDGNYHLKSGSPCIDHGWNGAASLPGLDVDGEPRIANFTVDIGSDEYWSTIQEAKTLGNNVPVYLNSAIVSAAWNNSFYIESDGRSSGIRIQKTTHGLSDDNVRASIVGVMQTDGAGERYVQASTATSAGQGTVKPLGISTRQLGGGDFLSSGIGQLGITGFVGLNNIGLLVRVSGKVSEIEAAEAPAQPTWFRIDDASGRTIRCTTEDGTPVINPVWLGKYAVVTGISSCEMDGSNIVPKIRVKKTSVPTVY